MLLGLIFRAVAIEYRGKGTSTRWRRGWDLALGLGSLVSAFGVGAALALTTTGLPLNANGDRVGGPFAWFNGYAVLGGLAVVGFCLVHAAAFLALKTDGDVRDAVPALLAVAAPFALLPLVAWVLAIQLRSGSAITWALVAVAAIAAAVAWLANRAGREGRAFLGSACSSSPGAASIFAAVLSRWCCRRRIDPHFDLTVSNASSATTRSGS